MRNPAVGVIVLDSGKTFDDILALVGKALGPETSVPSAIVARFQISDRVHDLWAISSRDRLDLRRKAADAAFGECRYDLVLVKDGDASAIARKLRALSRKSS